MFPVLAERKTVMIYMAMVKDQLLGKIIGKAYAKYEEILVKFLMLQGAAAHLGRDFHDDRIKIR